MTEEEKELQATLVREKATQDAALAAMNLNFALRNFRTAGGELDTVSRRLLDDTERLLNREGVRV